MSNDQVKKKKGKVAGEVVAESATHKLASEPEAHKSKSSGKASPRSTRRVTLKIEDLQAKVTPSPQSRHTAAPQDGAIVRLFDGLSSLNTPLANQNIPDDQNPIKRLATAIKDARMERRITQKELAHAVGVDTSFIAHLETLKENGALPSYARSQALERTLGFNQNELWTMVENARALMVWKRMKVQEELRLFELAEQGLVVPTETQATVDFSHVLSEEVSAQDFIETLSDLLKIINDPSKREHMRAFLRTHADPDDAPESVES